MLCRKRVDNDIRASVALAGTAEAHVAREPFTILFSCIGRRVALLDAFRRSLDGLGLDGRLLGADSSPFSAAGQRCDRLFKVKPSSAYGYVDDLLDLCRREHVNLLIPLIDPELQILAGQNARFSEVGTTLCLSSPRVIGICRDKIRTFEALSSAGIDTPQIYSYEQTARAELPLFMKPRGGSSARDIHRIEMLDELVFYHRMVPDAIFQEFLDGQEYTLDVFADFQGRPLSVVPRKRIEVRGGEVTKSMPVKDAALLDAGRRTVQMLGGCKGPITIQCFRTKTGRVAVIEINARFGGGAPLSIRAGADSPTWTIQCARGQTPQVDPVAFQDRLVMLRWDEAVFVREEDLCR
jgi:carbamoyl-phosphate synthase large subunit